MKGRRLRSKLSAHQRGHDLRSRGDPSLGLLPHWPGKDRLRQPWTRVPLHQLRSHILDHLGSPALWGPSAPSRVPPSCVFSHPQQHSPGVWLTPRPFAPLCPQAGSHLTSPLTPAGRPAWPWPHPANPPSAASASQTRIPTAYRAITRHTASLPSWDAPADPTARLLSPQNLTAPPLSLFQALLQCCSEVHPGHPLCLYFSSNTKHFVIHHGGQNSHCPRCPDLNHQNPWTRYLPCKGCFTDGHRLKIWRWRDCPRLCRWVQCHEKNLHVITRRVQES